MAYDWILPVAETESITVVICPNVFSPQLKKMAQVITVVAHLSLMIPYAVVGAISGSNYYIHRGKV